MNYPGKFSRTPGIILLILLGLCVVPFIGHTQNSRSSISLSGSWQFAPDPSNAGITQKWFLKALPDSIQLPGTMDLSGKGYRKKDTTTMHLNRVYFYEGAAWYRKEVTIPQLWQGDHIRLLLERTKPSRIWIDDQYIGESRLFESPQVYDLSRFLSPGRHMLTIRVDNSLRQTPYGGVHVYSDDTQTNWNGIIGSISLEASYKTNIAGLQVFPDIVNKKIRVTLNIDNQHHPDKIDIELQITKGLDGRKETLAPARYTVPCDSVIDLDYTVGDKSDLWDEYRQPLYHLNAILSSNGKYLDSRMVPFGMRKFTTKGTHFQINGRTTFLRGKHDGCVFPLTGCPPMDTAGWMRIFRIARSWGINHYRFHTWSPPEAAFDAADLLGIYLQPELPFWGGLDSDSIKARMKAEGLAVLKNYANHPSFVMFSAGNEIWGSQEKINALMYELKKIDSRPLYTQGSNNNIGYSGPAPGADYHTSARTPYAMDTILTHTRLTQAFADTKEGGILNMKLPSTTVNFDYPVSQTGIPLISHEVGQYQVFPDYDEIDKYTGVLKAWNLEIFRNRLKNAGMLDQDKDFTRASGALSALCYRAEIEAALRSGGMAGFQLLDLQDYPGQGTALVGMLDAFMDSKHVIAREEWDQFCNDVVPLLLFDKYCYTGNETFSASVRVANYSEKSLKNDLVWIVSDTKGNALKTGVFTGAGIPNEGLHTIGNIEFPLSMLKAPQKLTITLSISNTGYKNSYTIWVYPEPHEVKPGEITVATIPDKQVLNDLRHGKKVLLFPSAESVKQNSLPGLFPPDFWNWGMFKGISEGAKKPVSPGTLGILTNPEHPLFTGFPTDFYTNWQWWTIVKNSNPLILDRTAKGYRPLVQVIDNMERNHKLGLIFEFKVGKGKLLVCMSRLDRMQDIPEAAQLYNSIISYMKSGQFNPGYAIDETLMKEIFN